jgi:hypothetical protein
MIQQPEKDPQEAGKNAGNNSSNRKIVLNQTLTLTFHSQYNWRAINK